MGVLTEQLREFLDAHRAGVLATTASDGKPLLISTESKRLKARDALCAGARAAVPLCGLLRSPPRSLLRTSARRLRSRCSGSLQAPSHRSRKATLPPRLPTASSCDQYRARHGFELHPAARRVMRLDRN